MPRRREIGPGEIVSTKLAVEEAERLRALARQLGYTSLSALLRDIIRSFLASQGYRVESGAAAQPKPDPPQDPLLSAEVEDFKDALRRLEWSVERAELDAKPLFQVVSSGVKVWTSEHYRLRHDIEQRVQFMRKRWYELRRWHSRLAGAPEVKPLAGKLLELHRRISSLAKLVE